MSEPEGPRVDARRAASERSGAQRPARRGSTSKNTERSYLRNSEDESGERAPLAASWQLKRGRGAADAPAGRWRRLTSRYGWGIYAIPALIVLTVMATVQFSQPAGKKADASAGPSGEPATPEPPVVTEPSVKRPYSPELFAAELPPGGPIPKTGAGTFEIVPGSSKPVGSGELYHYTIEIETGVTLVEGNDSFARLVEATLSDPRGWINPRGGGISLQRVGRKGPRPDFRVTLISQNTAREVCGYGNGLPYDSSCRIGERVYISAARWVRGAVAYNGDIGSYRRYVINHEVGHVFGNGHVACPADGALAPVMMQQTFGVSNNVLHELNNRVPQGAEIPANGFVCEPNPWPFPVAKAAGG